MLFTWLPRFLVPIAIALAFALFRRMAPPRARMAEHRYDESQIPEPLPSGVIGGAMWSVGIALAMLFFVLRGANHLWASLEGPSLLTQYAPQVFGCFFPGFALARRCHHYLVLARDPVPWTSPNFEFLTLDDYPDFVKSNLI